MGGCLIAMPVDFLGFSPSFLSPPSLFPMGGCFAKSKGWPCTKIGAASSSHIFADFIVLNVKPPPLSYWGHHLEAGLFCSISKLLLLLF
jgi:hypothetical protein